MSNETQLCAVCGSQVAVGTRFCPNCGHAQAPAEQAAQTNTPPLGNPTVFMGATPPPATVTPAPVAPIAETQSWQPTQYIAPLQEQPQVAQPVQNWQPAYAPVQATFSRDPIIALLLELIGYVFVLGIGHMYAGRMARGIALMVGYWLYWGIAGFFFITIFLAPVACLMALLHPVVPIVSGIWAKREVERQKGSAYSSALT